MSWVGAGWRSACAKIFTAALLLDAAIAQAQVSEPPRAGFPPVADEAPPATPEAPSPAPEAPTPRPLAPQNPTSSEPDPGDSQAEGADGKTPPAPSAVPYRAPVITPPVTGGYIPPIQTPPTPDTQPPTVHPRPLEAPPRPELPPPPSDVCQDGRASEYETGIDCGGVCGPCPIDSPCRTQNDCNSGLCRAFVCRERSYTPGEAIPPGYHLETSTSDRATTARRAGIGFFVLSYGASYAGALAMPSSLAWLYVPLIGPWPLVSKAEEFAPEGGVRLTKMLLVADGAFQIAGALMWLGGTLGRGQQLVRSERELDTPSANLWVTPTLARGGYGLRVDALF